MSILNNSYSFNYQGKQSTIARFDPMKNSWTKLGVLNVARGGAGVIQVNFEFIVVGGSRSSAFQDEPTESCKLSEQSMICTTREPQLSSFEHFPELMLIP